MWDAIWNGIAGWEYWDEVGATGIWVVTVCLLVIGLAGCVIPVIPGHLVIVMGAVSHWFFFDQVLGKESGVEWWTFVVLVVLLAASQTFEFVSGAAGAKWFGGTKWGSAGALVGGLVGIFFMPFGLILGPLLGAYAFEAWFAKQETKPAVVSGVGSAVGTMAGIAVKIVVGVLMTGWLLADIWWIG